MKVATDQVRPLIPVLPPLTGSASSPIFGKKELPSHRLPRIFQLEISGTGSGTLSMTHSLLIDAGQKMGHYKSTFHHQVCYKLAYGTMQFDSKKHTFQAVLIGAVFQERRKHHLKVPITTTPAFVSNRTIEVIHPHRKPDSLYVFTYASIVMAEHFSNAWQKTQKGVGKRQVVITGNFVYCTVPVVLVYTMS